MTSSFNSENTFFVQLKPNTDWDFLKEMFSNKIPCDLVERHPVTKEIGVKISNDCLNEEQIDKISKEIAKIENVPVEIVTGSFFIKEKHIEQAYDSNNIPIDLKMYALTIKALKKVSQIEELDFSISGWDLHALVCILQVALRHPGLQNSPTGEQAKNVTLSFISALAQGDEDILRFYSYGFDSDLDQPTTSVNFN